VDEIQALRNIILELKDSNDSMRQSLLSVHRYLHGVRHTDARAMDEFVGIEKQLSKLGIKVFSSMEGLENDGE